MVPTLPRHRIADGWILLLKKFRGVMKAIGQLILVRILIVSKAPM